MIPAITHHPIPNAFAPNIQPTQITLDPNLSFKEKLKCIGLFDDQFNLLFTPSKIPSIKEQGQIRFNELMKKEVHCCTQDGEIIISLKHSKYISGFTASLLEKGIGTKTYLRGSYGAYVAGTADYFEFLVHEFLAFKNLPEDLFEKELEALKKRKEEAPRDVDLFDQVINSTMPANMLSNYCMEYFKSLTKEKIGFLQKMIPEISPLFPYPADYALFTLGIPKGDFQTDRIVGRLHHGYLHARDDIRIEIKNNEIDIPESAGNFWQMVLDRELKIVRTENWHEKDFRSGLAALQMIQNDHYLIEDNCTLQSIFNYALSTGSEKIFTGAIDRARLHCSNKFGFLMSVLIAYTHAAKTINQEIPLNHLEILNKAILETGHTILPLGSLYKLALLLARSKTQTDTYRAEWDTSGKGLLTLYVNEDRIIFPDGFSVNKTDPYPVDVLYEILENNPLGYLERVNLELTLQKRLTPLTNSMMDALVEYLIHTDNLEERHSLSKALYHWLPAAPQTMGWTKALLIYSFKHGLKVWNASKSKMEPQERLEAFEEIIELIAVKRPNMAYVLLEEEEIPKNLRIKLLKKIAANQSLSLDAAVKTIDEFIEGKVTGPDFEAFLIRTLETLPLKEGYQIWKKIKSSINLSPKLLQIIDRLISSGKEELLPEDEEWFFNTNPSKERIEALNLNMKGNAEILLKWVLWRTSTDIKEAATVLCNHKNECKALPEKYIKSIRQIHQIADKDTRSQMQSLAKEWIESFHPSKRMDQALLFFEQYEPEDYPLLDVICALNGLKEQEILEYLHLKALPVFSNRSFSGLLNFLKYNFHLDTKKEILKTLAMQPINEKDLKPLQHWMNANHSLSLYLISLLLEKNTTFLTFSIHHLISLKNAKNPSCNDELFPTLWLKALSLSMENPITLHELIPFYKNRIWIKSVYGAEMATKTREWAKALTKHTKLTESEKVVIKEMLSRDKLTNSSLLQLKCFLESIHNERLVKDDMLRAYFHDMVSTLLISIQVENEDRLHHFELLFKLFKLGMASKLHSLNGFTLMEQTLAFAPLLVYEGGSFDPVFQLLQTLPLVDYGSLEIYNQWNDKRNNLLQTWRGVSLPNDSSIQDLESNQELKILPYSLLQISLKYSHLFKLITEQYIENKVTKEEFQEEVRELSLSAAQNLKSHELMPHEDPCLICINDLSHLLKNKNKRVRTYEAFNYLLNQWANKTEGGSKSIDEQRKYLEIRKNTEDLIISLKNSVEKNKGIYSKFLDATHLYLINLHKSPALNQLHIRDPILDAFEIDSLHPLEKIDLIKLWVTKLELLTTPLHYYHAKKVRSLLTFEEKKLNQGEVYNILLHRIDLLKKSKRSSDSDKYSDGIMIFQAASLYLPQVKEEKLLALIEEILKVKIPVLRLNLEDNKETPLTKTQPLKPYLESIYNEKVTDEGLVDSFHTWTSTLVESVINEETPQYYPFNTVLNLVKMGIEAGFLTSDCLPTMGMMLIKAPQFLLEIENKVVFDPYLNLLESISLIEMDGEELSNEFNRQKEGFFQLWIQTLKLSENPHILTYANENKTLEFVPYETLKTIQKYKKAFKHHIEQFIKKEITPEEFKTKIAVVGALACKDIQIDKLTRHNDPCMNALTDLSYYSKNRDTRLRAYAAFNFLCEEWTKNMPLQPPYIGEYRGYLTFRRATEDLLLDQIDLLEKSEITYLDFFKTMTSNLRSLHESYILQNIHIHDPILDALELETLSFIDRVELLKLWEKVLKEFKTPLTDYQSEVIANYVKFESKKIKEQDVDNYIRCRSLAILKIAKPSLANASEIEIIFNTAANYLPLEKAQVLRNKMDAVLYTMKKRVKK